MLNESTLDIFHETKTCTTETPQNKYMNPLKPRNMNTKHGKLTKKNEIKRKNTQNKKYLQNDSTIAMRCKYFF